MLNVLKVLAMFFKNIVALHIYKDKYLLYKIYVLVMYVCVHAHICMYVMVHVYFTVVSFRIRTILLYSIGSWL